MNSEQTTTLPVHLVTGLLGSGKTTALLNFLKQKPAGENWGLLINEFGALDIDALSLQSHTDDQVISIAGGCICCSAQANLHQGINRLLDPQNQAIDRLWIEPTGLGHPAKIIDLVKQASFRRPLDLQSVICIATPKQLTTERWKKSAVMRDLVTLADQVILNKIDQASAKEVKQSQTLLASLYPPKQAVVTTEYSHISLSDVMQPRPPRPLSLLQSNQHELPQLVNEEQKSDNDALLSRHLQYSDRDRLYAIGWQFPAKRIFSRSDLKKWFAENGRFFQRGKGVLRCGLEWQRVNWSDQHVDFNDIAWRGDSRLELIIADSQTFSADDERIHSLEQQLIETSRFRE
ncbi:CobW family GTP-binding protein [Thiomicrorhabdus heinhorstiae]|uniref:GTP-binding protein n=1 Tax=Thiomicrorhabdus heinhorstiae TaxID=2748010 RepID=A0ABS0BV20_9GAMM|nr:GTP-binding protein [Thiomicrorhabdus heinhorstiae]MBF6057649.1 GTP-binding protein [Thiomicrorhabdus heinhorstiae]